MTTSDNRPAASATVSIKKTLKTSLTDEDGNFIFHHMQPGTYEIEVSYVGYETTNTSVTVENDKTVHLSIQLKISSTQLKQITVKYNLLQDEKTTGIGKSNIRIKDLPQAVTVS